jgi:cytochrome-b5 reductase
MFPNNFQILKCVPPPMKKAVAAHLKALDYAPEMQFHF